jgi:protoporphyrinogen oxidase
MSDTREFGIVGAGVIGLSLALKLRKLGHQVTLFDAAPEIGGLASTWRLNELIWDRHYHVILLSDLRVRELLAELELTDESEWVETKTGFYTDGELVSMSNSLEFLKFPPLGLIDKFRLALTIIRASKIKDPRKLEQISVESWLRKWSGNRTFEKIWLPLLRAKLGENYKIASASFIWAIIARMYAARRSGLKKEMFGYVRGGYQRILSQIESKLQSDEVDIRLSCPIQQVQSIDDRVQVTDQTGIQHQFDQVIITSNAAIASKICPELTSEEHERLNQVKYQGIICASVLMTKPLNRFYVTNITETWVPFTAVIEMTALVNPVELQGNHLVYLPKYVDPQDPMFNRSDESIREEFIAALEQMYPDFDRGNVLAFQLSRVRQVFAITTEDYSKSVPPVVTSIPGVSLLNSAHIVNGTLNVNECLQLVQDQLPTILNSVKVERTEGMVSV